MNDNSTGHSQADTVADGAGGRRRRRSVSEEAAPESTPLAEISPDLYRVDGERARGGMGRILKAWDRRLGRTVAIKELLPDSAQQAAPRFVREAIITARLQHPAIVPVYEAGRWPGGRPFYAMKLVEGETLEALIHQTDGLAARLAFLPHLLAVSEAVAYAHGQRVVHRDLKPANILVGPFGETVVVDWGLARSLREDDEAGTPLPKKNSTDDGNRTRAGTVLGTPQYMAPEQARGLPVDERADVYALGAMLYFLLTGLPPHAGTSAREAVEAVAAGSGAEPIQRLEPDAPADLVAVVHKAMANRPEDRYPSATELAKEVRRFQTGQLVSAHIYSIRELLRRFLRRHRTEVAVAVVLLAILAVSVATGFFAVRHQARVAEVERDRAERANEFLVGMLGSADPRVLGSDVTVASLLDVASRRVEKELGTQPEVKARVLTTLGTTYQGLGLLQPARARLEQALAAVRTAYGEEHVEMALALQRLAGAVEDEGDYGHAVRLLRQANDILVRLGETDGEAAAYVKGSLARVLRWLGQSEKAEPLYREVLAIQRRLPGDHRADIATTLNNLGVLLGERGEWDDAEPLHREALALVRAVHGPEHPAVAACLASLGMVVEQRGDLEGADALYRESLEMRERLLGPNHPDTVRSLYTLAGLQQARSKPAEAIEYCRKILALRGETLPDTHPVVAATLHIEGLSLLDLNRPHEAEQAFREALKLRRRSLPEGHWLIGSSAYGLGSSLVEQGRLSEAEPLLLEAYQTLAEARGQDDERTLEARRRLENLYRAWGRPQEAARWRETPKSATIED